MNSSLKDYFAMADKSAYLWNAFRKESIEGGNIFGSKFPAENSTEDNNVNTNDPDLTI